MAYTDMVIICAVCTLNSAYSVTAVSDIIYCFRAMNIVECLLHFFEKSAIKSKLLPNIV